MRIPDLDITEWIPIGQTAAGAVVLLATLTAVTARRRWRSAVSCVPARAGGLDLVHVAVTILVFLLLMAALNQVGTRLDPPGGLSEGQWMGVEGMHGLWPIMANNVAKLIVSALVCVLAALAVEGGLSGFGLRRDRIGRDVLWTVLGYLAIWPLCMGVAELIVWKSGKPPVHGVINLLRLPDLPVWGTVALWVSAVAISPIAEELVFRGLFQTVIRGYVDRPWLAILISAGAFGLMHYSQVQYVLPLAVLGIGLGYIYEHTGSLIAPILIHVLFNSRTLVVNFFMTSG